MNNNRVQVFSGNSEFLTKFGEKGNLDHQLHNPHGLSVTSNGDIIVADTVNKLIKIFSPRGQFKRKFGRRGSLSDPVHCIQTEQYFIVSDQGGHCIKVFDLEGNFVFKFGKEGNKEGEFNRPGYLSVNRDGHLMVCDIRESQGSGVRAEWKVCNKVWNRRQWKRGVKLANVYSKS